MKQKLEFYLKIKKYIIICINDFNTNDMICMVSFSYNEKEMGYTKNVWVGFDFYDLKVDIDDLTMEYAIESIIKIHSNLIFR